MDIIVFLFMVLFIYAGTAKLLDYHVFRAQIGKSPLITNYAHIFAWMVPAVEFIIALLLFIPRFRLVGLYASFSLMLAFTAYITFILTLSPYVPCSCGGILSTMGWSDHLIFNSAFTLLAVVGIALHVKQSKKEEIAFA
jgi:uncharacterized membrane protein YphA (DoxX/SURF4 family)